MFCDWNFWSKIKKRKKKIIILQTNTGILLKVIITNKCNWKFTGMNGMNEFFFLFFKEYLDNQSIEMKIHKEVDHTIRISKQKQSKHLKSQSTTLKLQKTPLIILLQKFCVSKLNFSTFPRIVIYFIIKSIKDIYLSSSNFERSGN